jgi:hypothetical protein
MEGKEKGKRREEGRKHTTNTRILSRIRHLLHIRHNRPLMTRINDVFRPRLQRVAPVEGSLRPSLHSNNSRGGFRRVGASVADDVVGGDFGYGLWVCVYVLVSICSVCVFVCLFV